MARNQSYVSNTRKAKAVGTNVSKIVGDYVGENAVKDKMLLARKEKAGIQLDDKEQDFMVDCLDEFDLDIEEDLSGIRQHSEQFVLVSDTYMVVTNDNNVTSDTPNMNTNEDEAVQHVTSLDQKNVVIVSLIENMQHEVECCNTVNQETKKVNDSLNAELEKYKEKVKKNMRLQ
ncbi:hypothetical protein Tco_1019267 [Tanacetum coccineum]|uniref:Uncharacterized protein n=1 Tax=Tanacetum coccineum TaxID=301880 RepID=A0ABQ5FWQ7_9ASTR